MGRWLKEFLAHTTPSLPDIPDTMMNESSGSGPIAEVSAKITSPDIADEPIPPLQSGWLVAYRDRQGVLCGGCDDRKHSTVQECQRGMEGWVVYLTDGQRLPLSWVRSVGKTDGEGRLIAAWSVRQHGYDGEREENNSQL